MSGMVRGIAAALLLAALIGAAQAEAAWSPPFAVTKDGRAYDPVLAASPQNGSVAVWLDGGTDAYWARRIAPNGRLGRELRISAEREAAASGMDGVVNSAVFTHGAMDDHGMDVTVDRSGRAVVAWYHFVPDRGHSLLARRISPDGQLGRLRQLAPPERVVDLDVEVAVDARGNATVVWSRTFGRPAERGTEITAATVHARRLSEDGRLGPRVDLPHTDSLDRMPAVAVAPGGDATVAWLATHSGGAGVRAAKLGSDGAVGRPHELAAPLERWSGDRPTVVADASGGATVAWVAPRPDGSGSQAFARAVSADDGLGSLRLLLEDDRASSIGVTSAASGSALVVRHRIEGVAEPTGRRQDQDGVPSPIWQLSTPWDGYAHRLAVEPGGTSALLAWAAKTDIYTSPRKVQARRIAADGRPGPVATLAHEPKAYVGDPELFVDAHGTALALWPRNDHSGSTLHASRLVSDCTPVRLRRAAAKPRLGYARGRRRGVRVRLTFDRAVDARLAGARLTFRDPRLGRHRSVVLPHSRRTVGANLRVPLPARLRGVLQQGQPVSLSLRLRTRLHASGCRYGKPQTAAIRARVGWIG